MSINSNDNDLKAALGELTEGITEFKEKHTGELKALQSQVDELVIARVADQMGGNRTNTTEAPTDGVRSLRTYGDFQAHYAKGVSARDAADAVPMAEFLRGVAGMKTSERAVKALSGGTDSAGGFAVPNIVMPRILDAMTPASSLL